MSALTRRGNLLFDPATKQQVGYVDLDGVEQSGSLVSGAGKSVRQVATRCRIPTQVNGGQRQAMSRHGHVAFDDLTALQIAIPNFYMVSGVETGTLGAMTCQAGIEYPAGTIAAQFTFNGSLDGGCADLSFALSDMTPLAATIPKGARFWTRVWRSNASGIPYIGTTFPAAPGDGIVLSATTTPNLVLGGAVTQATVNVLPPCGLFALSGRRAAVLQGDSNGHGSGDVSYDQTGNVGFMEKAIAPVAAVLNLATPSDRVQAYLTPANSTNRRLLAAYGTDLVYVYGTNDIAAARTAAQIAADYASIAALLPTKRHYMCTIVPRTTSTDAWATTANQTVLATEAVRIATNSLIRAGIAGFEDCFDTADAAETSRNSGIWGIDSGDAAPAGTADGVHGITKRHQFIARSGAIRQQVFVQP